MPSAGTRSRRSRSKAPGKAGDTSLRMRDLVRESGLTRETIHFYIAQGLVPPGRKTGRNTAVYGTEHLARLQGIRALQDKHFLPLKGIRKIFNEADSTAAFTSGQEAMLRRARMDLPDWVRPGAERFVALAGVIGGRLTAEEVRFLKREGLIQVRGRGKSAAVSEEDAVVLDTWARLKEIGIGPDHGYDPSVLRMWDRTIEQLVRKETASLARGYANAPAATTADVIQRAFPLVDRLLSAIHRKKVRRLFARVARADDDP
ncbi:MAG: MerR family transcriptional regulator [Gammaproteobacteria bacterium]|nr:MerR family transcriptional regulator [Gammaproteobacteria bacterium]